VHLLTGFLPALYGLDQNGVGAVDDMYQFPVIGPALAAKEQYGYLVTGNTAAVVTVGCPGIGDKQPSIFG